MHISIIDDEKVLTNRISKKLMMNGFTVSEFFSYGDFMTHGLNVTPSDLYIIDISLKDGTWFQIIDTLRNMKHIYSPIIIMSWFNDLHKKVFGLDLWADDYITKPFSPEELLARVRAIMRRSEIVRLDSDYIHYKDITLNLNKKEILLNNQKVDLTKKEYALTELFLVNKWVVVERASIVRRVWWSQDTMDITDNTINVTVSKIKKKLGDTFDLKTRYGHGFILD